MTDCYSHHVAHVHDSILPKGSSHIILKVKFFNRERLAIIVMPVN